MTALAFDTHQAVTALIAAGAEWKTDLGHLEARLHRHLWVVAAGIIGLTVALVRLTA